MDAELILFSILEKDRAYLLTHPEHVLSSSQRKKWARWLRKRGDAYPLQYLVGKQEFYKRDFAVGPEVLIPRPETEVLVDVCLDLLETMAVGKPRVLDVGTGSGVIAVTLARENKSALVTATDISSRALSLARQNAVFHKCEKQIEFLEGSGMEPLKARGEPFDLVVSNPPYVGVCTQHLVDKSVSMYEPREAVFARNNGLEMYEALFKECPRFMKPGAPLVLEIGAGAKRQVCQEARIWAWRESSVKKDLAGIDRCLVFAHGNQERRYS